MKKLIPLLSILLTGCQFIFPEAPKLDVTGCPAEIIKAEGSTITLSITSTHPWNANVADPWVRLYPLSGEAGQTELTLEIYSNDYHEERTAEIIFTSEDVEQIIEITQMQDDYMELSSTSASFNAEGGLLTIESISNIPYEISIDEDAQSWIIQNKTKAVNNEYHDFTICRNTTTADREGYIRFEGNGQILTYTVTQSGFYPEIIIPEQEFYCNKEGEDINVTVICDFDLRVECPFDWIHQTNSTDDDVFNFTIDPNEGVNVREGHISFISDTYDICANVYVTQGCDSPFISVTPSNINIPATSNSFDVTVEGNIEAEVSIDCNWLTLTGQAGNIYSFTASSNNTLEAVRKARITFLNKEHGIQDYLIVSQENIKEFTPAQDTYAVGYMYNTLTVNYYSTASFSISTDADWIKILNSIYPGNNSLSLKIQENTDNTAREATIEVYDTEHRFQFKIVQNGRTSNDGSIDDMEHIEW